MFVIVNAQGHPLTEKMTERRAQKRLAQYQSGFDNYDKKTATRYKSLAYGLRIVEVKG